MQLIIIVVGNVLRAVLIKNMQMNFTSYINKNATLLVLLNFIHILFICRCMHMSK